MATLAPQSRSSAAVGPVAQAARPFGARDRFFRLQVALVAGWVVVSLATLAGVLAAGPPSGNSLGAEVRAELAIGGPVLLVTNSGPTAWMEVTYTLNGTYLYRQATLAPGDHLTLPVGRFRKGSVAGQRAPRDLEPRLLEIACEAGRARLPIPHLVRPP